MGVGHLLADGKLTVIHIDWVTERKLLGPNPGWRKAGDHVTRSKPPPVESTGPSVGLMHFG
jgi:hypothetical protein